MKDGTLNIIKTTLDNDETLTQEAKHSILAFCKNPQASSTTGTTANAQPVKYLTPNQVSEILGVCPRSVHRWISTGQLPSKKLGECRRVPSNALDDLSALAPIYSTTKPKRGFGRVGRNGRNNTTGLNHKQDVLEKAS
jgi:excisionase family DNA binding protein